MKYLCYECGAAMKKADKWVLVCPECGHSVNIGDYMTEEEDYDDLYSGGSRYDDDMYWHDNEEFPGEPEDNEDEED